MIVFILIIFFLQILLSSSTTTTNIISDISNIRYNSLISAQCKCRCLYEYQNHSHQHHRLFSSMFNNGKTKRLLSTNVLTLPWRSIWERCPRIITCSSCLLPCDLDPSLLLSNKQTCQAICSTLKIQECEDSCLFIKKLYEKEFNCQTKNCSKKISQPTNVIAIERKSRRTVRLKWNTNHITNLEPIIYVIEAQWILPSTDENQFELVSKWGLIKEEISSTKAIIRNIPRDNRWYKFRVAAVTQHGYSIFSMTTKPFRLSQNQSQILSSIIDSPKNISIKDYQFNFDTINITLIWIKPDSPVNKYQISWELENDSSSFVNSIDTSSMELSIPFLSLDKTYLFKIRSIVQSKNNDIQMSLPLIKTFNYIEEFLTIKNLQISKPYFLNGLIKINISWNIISNHHIKQYELFWIENKCSTNIFSCCYKRDAITIKNFFQLYDLRFNCIYLLNIQIIGYKKNKSIQTYFNVSSCELTDVYGIIQPPCQYDRKIIDIFSSLPTLDLIVTSNETGFNLFWQYIYLSINHVFYQLNIEQLPNNLPIISVTLPLVITNYFIPYSKTEDNRYLNVTLSLIDNITIRQQQSILIHDKREYYFHTQLNNSSIIYFKSILFLLNFLIIFNR